MSDASPPKTPPEVTPSEEDKMRARRNAEAEQQQEQHARMLGNYKSCKLRMPLSSRKYVVIDLVEFADPCVGYRWFRVPWACCSISS